MTETLPARVDRIERRQLRLRVAGALLSVFFVLALGVFGGVQQYQNCSRGNDFRRFDKARWDYIESLAPTPTPGTPEARGVTKFNDYIAQADAQRNCDPLSGL